MTSVTFIIFHPTTIRFDFIEPYFNKRDESPVIGARLSTNCMPLSSL
jgi:hypothetical protein